MVYLHWIYCSPDWFSANKWLFFITYDWDSYYGFLLIGRWLVCYCLYFVMLSDTCGLSDVRQYHDYLSLSRNIIISGYKLYNFLRLSNVSIRRWRIELFRFSFSDLVVTLFSSLLSVSSLPFCGRCQLLGWGLGEEVVQDPNGRVWSKSVGAWGLQSKV